MIKLNKISPQNSPHDRARKLNANADTISIIAQQLVDRVVPYTIKFEVLGEEGGSIVGDYNNERVESPLVLSYYDLKGDLDLTASPDGGKVVKQWIVNNVFVPHTEEEYNMENVVKDNFRYLSLDGGYELEIYVEFDDDPEL